MILLADDNNDMRLLLRDLLEWGGHEVILARTGREGLELLQSNQIPDLIISDITMPQMDGIEFFHHVRANPDWSHIRFVIMSANPYDDRINDALAAGLAGMLPKPFSLEDLNALLS
jgi:CheY-like chemotaxis protein